MLVTSVNTSRTPQDVYDLCPEDFRLYVPHIHRITQLHIPARATMLCFTPDLQQLYDATLLRLHYPFYKPNRHLVTPIARVQHTAPNWHWHENDAGWENHVLDTLAHACLKAATGPATDAYIFAKFIVYEDVFTRNLAWQPLFPPHTPVTPLGFLKDLDVLRDFLRTEAGTAVKDRVR